MLAEGIPLADPAPPNAHIGNNAVDEPAKNELGFLVGFVVERDNKDVSQ